MALTEKNISKQGVWHLLSFVAPSRKHPQGCSAHLCRTSQFSKCNPDISTVPAGQFLSHTPFRFKKSSTGVTFWQVLTNESLPSTFSGYVQCKKQTKPTKRPKEQPQQQLKQQSPPVHHVPNSTGTYLLYLLHLWPLQVSQTDSLVGQAVLKLRQHWTCSMPVNWSRECQIKLCALGFFSTTWLLHNNNMRTAVWGCFHTLSQHTDHTAYLEAASIP